VKLLDEHMVKSSKYKHQREKLHIIPNELMQFVHRDTYSLLIKGYSGAGKTTLSLTLLRALKIKTNFFYISTRISPKQLFVYYPWLGKFNEDPKSSELEQRSDSGYDLSCFEDARLDEPESLFERITNQLMDVKAPIIIIDSWDAIASFMDKEARLNNERVLQTWRERAGAKLIFISEDPKDTTLDFLVDGVVELQQKTYENIKIREITIWKLRGVRINKLSYFFTLNNGIFQSYDPYNPTEFFINPLKPSDAGVTSKRATEQVSLLYDSFIRSGYQEFDISLGGGFPRKGIVVIENDPYISSMVTLAFLARIILNFVRTGNPVLIQPILGIHPTTIISYIKSNLHIDPKDLVKIFWPHNQDKALSNYIIPYSKGTEMQYEFFYDAILKTRREHPNKLLLNIMSADKSRLLFSHVENDGKEILSLLRNNSDLSLILSESHSASGFNPSGISDVHLKLSIINDTLFLRTIAPSGHLHAILSERFSGYPKVKLESIV
jgi:KaiC/GvpD/RAD55 family RecA-like ATPase